MSKEKNAPAKAKAEDGKVPPLLAIVIPARNCAGSALRMLQEIDSQRNGLAMKGTSVWTRLRVLVVDDASDDETRRFLVAWKESHDYVHVELMAERSGAGGCRNYGAKFAMESMEAKYVAFFDADDFLMPDAVGKIMTVLADEKADCVQWGFRTLNKDASRDNAWIPKYANPDEWVTIPVAPWLHAIRPHLVAQFPTHLLTDDAIWWFRQAQILHEARAKFYFIHEPLYVYDRRTGGCTRASDYFSAHPTTLEQAAAENVCTSNGFPDRYVSDCLRNLADMYDMRNTLTGDVYRQFMRRFKGDIAACWTGHWGW